LVKCSDPGRLETVGFNGVDQGIEGLATVNGLGAETGSRFTGDAPKHRGKCIAPVGIAPAESVTMEELTLGGRGVQEPTPRLALAEPTVGYLTEVTGVVARRQDLVGRVNDRVEQPAVGVVDE